MEENVSGLKEFGGEMREKFGWGWGWHFLGFFVEMRGEEGRMS